MPSKKSSFLRAFQFIDIFGLKTEFQIDQKPKFKTISGGFFTFLYIGFIILLFFSFGSDMINRTNPETSVSQIYQPSPSPTIVSKDDYMFVFGIQDSTGSHFIDEEIYNATLIYSSRNPTTRQDEVKVIPIQRCEEANMPSNSKLGDYFKNQANELSDMYCISKNYTDPLVLQGSWDQLEYSYFRLFISPCNGSLRTCKSDNEINAMLKTGFYAYYSTDNLFDLRNYNSPANIFGRDFFTETTTAIKKIITRYLRTNHLYDDGGWITNSLVASDYFSFDNDGQSFELLTETGNIVDMTIRKSAYESVLTRNYKKVQNVFAEMTGFLQIIFAALYIISGPFIRKEYYESLTNSIYNFEVDPNQKKKKRENNKKRKVSLEHKEKLKSLKTIMMGNEKDNDSPEIGSEKLSQSYIKKKKKNDEELVNYLFKLKESPLNLTYFEIVKGFFVQEPDLEVKKSQRKVGVASIFSQLDIKFVLKKFAEIDKLKMLLLNEDQYHLFEYLPKPVITKNAKINLNHVENHENNASPIKISVSERKSTLFLNQNDFVLKAKTVQKAFENIVKKTEMNEIDRKLIQSLDADILKVLEANLENVTTVKVSKFAHLLRSTTDKEKIAVEMESLADLERGSEFSEKKEEIITERNTELLNTFKLTDSK